MERDDPTLGLRAPVWFGLHGSRSWVPRPMGIHCGLARSLMCARFWALVTSVHWLSADAGIRTSMMAQIWARALVLSAWTVTAHKATRFAPLGWRALVLERYKCLMVVAKNTATWCSELVAGQIISDKRKDMNFEWFEDFGDTYRVTIYGNSTETKISIIKFCALFFRLLRNQKPFMWHESTCKGDFHHTLVHLNCRWFELTM
jgi:hypothetical protein